MCKRTDFRQQKEMQSEVPAGQNRHKSVRNKNMPLAAEQHVQAQRPRNNSGKKSRSPTEMNASSRKTPPLQCEKSRASDNPKKAATPNRHYEAENIKPKSSSPRGSKRPCSSPNTGLPDARGMRVSSPSKSHVPEAKSVSLSVFAGAKFSDPPSPALLPKPPTHWLAGSSLGGRNSRNEITNVLMTMLKVQA